MKSINLRLIRSTVASLCQEANYNLGEDVIILLKKALRKETSPQGKEVLSQLIKNAAIAGQEKLPLCQDCGTVLIFVELGQDVHIVGGNLIEGLNDGIREGYRQGHLRMSMVAQPFTSRINTGDNTPAVVHTKIVPGDSLSITLLPKGAGSENMSRLAMLKPAQGRQGIVDFVIEAVEQAGSNPCPPIIVGVGIGGTADKAMVMAKEALLRKTGTNHHDKEVAQLENEILSGINALGIGPAGLGGRTTALAVHAEVFPCHIASLPVAVALQCHSARHKNATL
ncbi:MAG: fumarate hydratase [Dehalococcoidia bacterium]|nr:fumarate hydratase [Dehalococcoidia bacterium]